jgi:hypothetical protein
MNKEDNNHRLTEQSVQEDLQRQPHILLRLAENALTVAESLRDNYFKNTASFVGAIRRAIYQASTGERDEPLISIHDVSGADWSQFQNEHVSFIDGGIGRVQISSQIPILLRVGTYCVRTGERALSQRENFGYYPVILGDLEGGSKERKDFPDIVRITAELLGGLAVLERTPDLRLLMFHGPLVYMMSAYAGHTPFTENDIDRFLRQYADDTSVGMQLKEDFLQAAKLDIYPKMTPRSDEWVQKRLFEPLAWISFLYRRLINTARSRNPVPLILGVVERGELREFSRAVLLERIFRSLRAHGNEEYFNQLFGRTDLRSPDAIVDRLGYTDSLLLAMVLQTGQVSEPWTIDKYSNLRNGNVTLPGEVGSSTVEFSHLKPNSSIGFPAVRGCYIQVNETTEPIRMETFQELGDQQILEGARRAYLYARLLPGYGFPVGLDIADKHAHIPNWMTDAYAKQIKYQLGVSLQRGEITDADMRRILVQTIYMTQRDWLFRPNS